MMSLEEEIKHVRREHLRVWNHLLGVDAMDTTLPKFDDNDEMYFSRKEKEERDHEDCNS